MRILFVDNHADFTSIVAGKFLADHDLVIVATIAGALGALEQGRFDLALVDYDLDDGKGDALVPAIPVPVIAVSARERGNAALVTAGAVATCAKLDFARIGAVIDDVMRAR